MNFFVQAQSASPSWLVETGLPLLIALIGAFMGFVFVIAWKGSATRNVDLRKDPRVKGLLYGLSGFVTTLIADWKSLLGQGVDKTQLLILYGFPFMIVGIGGVLLIALVIWIDLTWSRRKRFQEFPIQPFHLTLDYLHYGYAQYREEYERLVEVARNYHQQQRLERLRSLPADIFTNLAAMILSPSPSIQDILRNMCTIIKAHSDDANLPDVNANLMVAVKFDRATEDQKRHLKFTFGDATRYGHLLMLTEYAYDKGEERIALPVEDPNRTHDWIDWTLFGAPEAFLRNRETIVNVKHLDFAAKVPQTVRRQMREYFRGKGFKSFGCLTVIGKGSIIGIVNIESSREFGSDEIQNEIAKILQPFCAVLSLILQRETN